MTLSYAFKTSTEGVFLHTRANGKPFNLARVRAKTKVRHVVIREMLFADDAALVTHTMEDLQQLIDRLSHASKEFGLTISIKKTNVMGQGIVSHPSINIDNVTLDAVDSFTYLGSTIESNRSLYAELKTRIAKAAAVMSKLNSRVWQNNNLTKMTKLCVYQACVLSTLSQDKITNKEILDRAYSFSMYTLLSQRRLRWLGHVHRMANGHIPKDILYGELVTGTSTVGRPYLRYRDTCKRDMKVARIDTTTWEAAADDRGHWRAVVKAGMRRGEENRCVHEAVKREKRKQKS